MPWGKSARVGICAGGLLVVGGLVVVVWLVGWWLVGIYVNGVIGVVTPIGCWWWCVVYSVY